MAQTLFAPCSTSVVFYPLNQDQLLSERCPWMENCKLLIVARLPEERQVIEALKKYCDTGQDYLSFTPVDPNVNPSFNDLQSYLEGKSLLGCQLNCSVDFEEVSEELFKRVLEDSFEIASSDCGDFQISKRGSILGSSSLMVSEWLSSHKMDDDRLFETPHIKIAFNSDTKPREGVLELKSDLVPDTFDPDLYFKRLTTRSLGRLLLHIPVVQSSMDFVSGPSLGHGVGIVPDLQLNGQGRGGNAWISPAKSAMFTLQVRISLKSELGRKLPLVQHLPGLAVVQALRKISPCLEIGIKWPNDIYFEGKTKMGGILTKTSTCGSDAFVNYGVGFNLSNEKPLVSFNQILRSRGQPEVEREVYLAEVFNHLENLIFCFEEDSKSFFESYHQCWIHGGQEVTVKTDEESNEGAFEAVVEGLDEWGFLLVRNKSSGDLVTVHPDGNSFDMMRGLIFPKMRN